MSSWLLSKERSIISSPVGEKHRFLLFNTPKSFLFLRDQQLLRIEVFDHPPGKKDRWSEEAPGQGQRLINSTA